MFVSRIYAIFLVTIFIGLSSCTDEEPTFRYVTAYNKEGRLMKKNDIHKTSVNVLTPIIFLINGLDKDEPKTSDWYKNLMDEYLSKQVNNVFLVDWKFDSKAHTNQTKSAGFCIADFIQGLYERTGESHLDIHLVGVLAGSQVAVSAAKRLGESPGRKVNRITALDPTYYLINDEDVKLDAENANFVDVVHSDLSKFGKHQFGHVSFYIDTTACKEDFGKLAAVQIFAKSINSNRLTGVECDSAEDFTAGKCADNEAIVFGENVDRSVRGAFFLAAC